LDKNSNEYSKQGGFKHIGWSGIELIIIGVVKKNIKPLAV